MKYGVVLVLGALVLRAQSIPIAIGPNPSLSLPAVDNHGLTAVVSSSVSPDGQLQTASDLYLLRTGGAAPRKLTSLPNRGAAFVDLSADGSKVAFNVTASTPPGIEEIHVVDTATTADLRVAVDTVGCIQPLAAAICLGCFFSCVRTVHLSPDASKIVYSASETQPLYIVNADGSGALHLPVQKAALAPAPQRVVSRNGLLVFSTFTDVYTIHLDGSGMQNLTANSCCLYIGDATISEDGGTIAFQAVPQVVMQSTPSGIYILHSDGNPPRLLTASRFNDATSPSLSADGSQVAYIQGGQAYIQRADGFSQPDRITTFAYQTANAVTLSGDASTALISTGTAIYTAATGMKPQHLFAPQFILPNGVTSYSGLASPSPGSLIRIAGWNLQDDTSVIAITSPLPVSLGGVSLQANGQPIPLAWVAQSFLIAQLPFTTPSGPTNFAIDFTSGPEVTASVAVKDTAPEVLQYVQPFFTSTYAAAFHAGTSIPADQAHPATAGEALEMYGVGLGAVSPAVDAGMPGPSNPPARAIAAPQVKIGNQNATVTFAGLAPGQVGIYQVDAIVPSGLKTGSQPVSWSVAGQPVSVNWVIFVK